MGEGFVYQIMHRINRTWSKVFHPGDLVGGGEGRGRNKGNKSNRLFECERSEQDERRARSARREVFQLGVWGAL